MRQCREPVKIVNGPEVFGSLVGKSEENVRALFKEAEDEQRKMGDDSMLHVIILDEVHTHAPLACQHTYIHTQPASSSRRLSVSPLAP